MKKIIYALFAVAITALSGCTKLEENLFDKIPGSDYPENADQVANLSVDAYKRLQNLVDDNGWWFLAQELSSDGFVHPPVPPTGMTEESGLICTVIPGRMIPKESTECGVHSGMVSLPPIKS